MTLGALSSLARHPSVDSLIGAARDVLRMDVAYTGAFRDSEQVFENFAGDGASFGVGRGTRLPLEATYCQQVLDEQLPSLVADMRTQPQGRNMAITAEADVGAFATVPMWRSDGTLYGTLCCASHAARHDLAAHHLDFMRVLARLTVDTIERDELARELRRLQMRTAGIEALAVAVTARDSYTGEHSQAVVELAARVAAELDLGEDAATDVEHVALLHDIGKLMVPEHILHKPAALDAREWEIMRRHPADGATIVGGLPELSHLAPMIRAEHERWDGGGYPDGLAGEAIPIEARIALVCDAYHALTSDRPYRAAQPLDAAVAEIKRHAGTQFCPRSSAALLAVIGRDGQ